MPTKRSSRPLLERTLDLSWSLWAELGVSGWIRRHKDWGIDPEPLIVLTAAIGDADPRLRDETLDWCLSYGRYISRVRLKNLLRAMPNEVVASFCEYSATVNAHSTFAWPAETKPLKFKASGKSVIEDFTPSALLALRLRALLGVGARAEALRVVMQSPSPVSTSEVARKISYTKRNVSDALESLKMSGVLVSHPTGNVHRYSIGRAEIRRAITPFPKVFPDWTSILKVLIELLTFDTRVDAKSPTVRAVEARSAADRMGPALEEAGLVPAPNKPHGEAYLEVFQTWAEDLLTGLAFAEPRRVFQSGRTPTI